MTGNAADQLQARAPAGVGGNGLGPAAIRANETARPDRLFADPLAAAFVAAAGWTSRRRPGDRRAAALSIWVVARTVFFDELLTSAARGGCRQVVLLGAGLDARAFRLSWPPGVRYFELDTADMLERKARVLAAQAGAAGCERIAVACGLTGDWPAALLAAGLRPGQPTAWIAEGLLAYLMAEDIDGVLADLTALSAPGSRLGLTVASRGSPAGGGAPDLADPVRWLAGHGWAAQVTGAPEVLRARGRQVPSGTPEERRSGAKLVSATRDVPRPSRRPAASRKPARGQGADPAPAHRPGPAAGPAEVPWPSLLAQALVAFTIEFDNEFEHQMPHRTTRGPAAGSRRGPWLVSQVMWSNFMRFVGDNGVSAGELRARAGMAQEPIDSQLARMEKWWGYVVVEPDPSGGRPRPPRRDRTVRPTPDGRRARQVWEPLAGVIEQRWRARFGADEIGRLAGSLRALVSRFDVDLPCYLPVGGLAALRLERRDPASRDGAAADLSTLMSQVLLAFTVDFERESALPLTIAANALRALAGPGTHGVRVRDIPRLAGVAKEAAGPPVRLLESRGLVVVEPDPAGGRARLARLTRKGREAQDTCRRLVGVIDRRWQERFGADDIRGLRESLEALLRPGGGGPPRLAEGLQPYPGGWRAHPPYLAQTTGMISDPGAALPHYPLVSHRGGFPDGS